MIIIMPVICIVAALIAFVVEDYGTQTLNCIPLTALMALMVIIIVTATTIISTIIR